MTDGEVRQLAGAVAASLDRDPSLPPILVGPVEAARLLGMSPDSFARYVRPEVRAVRRRRLVLFLVRDLDRWAEANAALPLEGDR